MTERRLEMNEFFFVIFLEPNDEVQYSSSAASWCSVFSFGVCTVQYSAGCKIFSRWCPIYHMFFSIVELSVL